MDGTKGAWRDLKHIKTTYTCDMCGAEIDLSDDDVRGFAIVGTNMTSGMPVYEHNPRYDEGYQDGIGWERLDLCPICAARACAIRQDWFIDDDGRFSSKLSWRDGR